MRAQKIKLLMVIDGLGKGKAFSALITIGLKLLKESKDKDFFFLNRSFQRSTEHLCFTVNAKDLFLLCLSVFRQQQQQQQTLLFAAAVLSLLSSCFLSFSLLGQSTDDDEVRGKVKKRKELAKQGLQLTVTSLFLF